MRPGEATGIWEGEKGRSSCWKPAHDRQRSITGGFTQLLTAATRGECKFIMAQYVIKLISNAYELTVNRFLIFTFVYISLTLNGIMYILSLNFANIWLCMKDMINYFLCLFYAFCYLIFP